MPTGCSLLEHLQPSGVGVLDEVPLEHVDVIDDLQRSASFAALQQIDHAGKRSDHPGVLGRFVLAGFGSDDGGALSAQAAREAAFASGFNLAAAPLGQQIVDRLSRVDMPVAAQTQLFDVVHRVLAERLVQRGGMLPIQTMPAPGVGVLEPGMADIVNVDEDRPLAGADTAVGGAAAAVAERFNAAPS